MAMRFEMMSNAPFEFVENNMVNRGYRISRYDILRGNCVKPESGIVIDITKPEGIDLEYYSRFFKGTRGFIESPLSHIVADPRWCYAWKTGTIDTKGEAEEIKAFVPKLKSEVLEIRKSLLNKGYDADLYKVLFGISEREEDFIHSMRRIH